MMDLELLADLVGFCEHNLVLCWKVLPIFDTAAIIILALVIWRCQSKKNGGTKP